MQKKTPLSTKNRLNWQTELANSYTHISDLCQFLRLSPHELPVSAQASKQFPLRVPQSFADCMEKGNPNDPLLRQVLPINDEMKALPGFVADPVGDLNSVSETGVLHKYFGRVLFITSGGCAINCRYCFRRNFPYAENQLNKQREAAALAYVRNNSDINEVILSGGDPLLLSDARLVSLIEQIAAIKHVQRIRIHSRIPVVLPSRINAPLLTLLQATNKQLILVLHCNHANELSPAVAQACDKLQQYKVLLLNQSVLLAGINDTPEQLVKLSNQLFNFGVLPYYLHLLDKATGTGHFEVSKADAIAIMQQVQNKLPGYLVPKLVTEQMGALSKHSIL